MAAPAPKANRGSGAGLCGLPAHDRGGVGRDFGHHSTLLRLASRPAGWDVCAQAAAYITMREK